MKEKDQSKRGYFIQGFINE